MDPLDISKENPYFGESRESRYYDCLNCCFCDRAVPMSWQQVKEKEECDENGEGEPVEGEEEWQKEIAQRIKDRGTTHHEGVNRLDYRQFIHRNCMSILTREERRRLKERNRNNIYIPSELTDYGVNCNLVYKGLAAVQPRNAPNTTPDPLIWKLDPFTGKPVLTYDVGSECGAMSEEPFRKTPILWARCPVTGVRVRTAKKSNTCVQTTDPQYYQSPKCARCDIVVDQGRPGLAYPQGYEVKYIHYYCYKEIKDVRVQQAKDEAYVKSLEMSDNTEPEEIK